MRRQTWGSGAQADQRCTGIKTASAVCCSQTDPVPCHSALRRTCELQTEAPSWTLLVRAGLQPCTLAVPGQTRQLRLLPPPTDRSNPLDMVAVASTAEVSVWACHGVETRPVSCELCVQKMSVPLHNRASHSKHHPQLWGQDAPTAACNPRPPCFDAAALLPAQQEVLHKQVHLLPLLPCFSNARPTGLPGSSRLVTSRATVPLTDWLDLQVVLLVLPGDKGSVLLDAAGEAALAVLRTMGLPGLMAAVQGSSEASLKERAAAKKLGEAAVSSQVGSASVILVCLWRGKCCPDAQLDMLIHTGLLQEQMCGSWQAMHYLSQHAFQWSLLGAHCMGQAAASSVAAGALGSTRPLQSAQ